MDAVFPIKHINIVLENGDVIRYLKISDLEQNILDLSSDLSQLSRWSVNFTAYRRENYFYQGKINYGEENK